MHEASLAMNIMDIVKDEMKKFPGEKLNKIFIDIGEFTHIDPETLKFAFEVISKGSDYDGACLEIERIPLILSCKICDEEFSVAEITFKCPSCKSTEVQIVKGREFRITQLEVD